MKDGQKQQAIAIFLFWRMGKLESRRPLTDENTRNERRNLQLSPKVARNAKQFVQRLSKWQETCVKAHFFFRKKVLTLFLVTF